MAKKSAKSKGYRRQNTEKPYLSKRDVALLCVLVAAIAVAAFFLFRYDDGALKVQNGAVVTEGDNWLIVNGSNTRGRARYFKVGEIGELDGYSRESGPAATDANLPEYTFTPEAEDTGIVGITVTGSHNAASTLAASVASLMSELEDSAVGEVQTARLDDRDVSYFIYTSESTLQGEAAEGEEGEAAGPDTFAKVLSGYFDAPHDSCVAMHIETTADSAENYLPDETLVALLEQAVKAVALESAE